MTVLTDRLAYPNLKKVVLLEVTAGEHLRHWVLTSGKTYTYESATVAGGSCQVVDVKSDGVSLTYRESIALVEANAGSWYWDRATHKVHVHPAGNVSPYTKTIQAILRFHFSTDPRVYNDIYYDPRISALPTLSMKIERAFGDPGTMGTGAVELANNDGFFDALTGLQWDAGTAVLKMGADYQSLSRDILYPLADGTAYADGTYPLMFSSLVLFPANYSDFETVGAFRVSGWDKKDQSFSLDLEDMRKDLKKKIPLAFYTRDAYPNMAEDSVGEPIPMAYGVIYDVSPVCIDTTTRTFKVAGQDIKRFLEVRVRDEATGVWHAVNMETQSEPYAQFTLAAADWDGTAAIAVDFEGKVHIDGTLMDNAARVVKDILGTIGEEIDLASILESEKRLHLGTDVDGEPVSARRVSLYLDKTRNVDDVIADINGFVGSYLFPDHEGIFRYVVFEPEPGDSLPVYDEGQGDIFSFTEMVVAEEIISSVRATYQYRKQQDYSQVALYERAEAQYLQDAAAAVLLDEDVPCDRLNDTTYWAQREAKMRGERQRMFKVVVSHRGWTLRPAQQIRVVYDRHGINQVFEVLEVKKNLTNTLRVELLLGDLHGFGKETGFLSSDAPVFPASLGGGSAEVWNINWTTAQKAWARQNVGYISDDNGFADPADPESLNTFVVV